MFALLLVLACSGPPPEPDQPEENILVPADEGSGSAEGSADVPAVVPAGEQATQRVFFVEPAEGATLKSPFKVVFGIEGMTVEPAGDINENKGHHHILINDAAGVAGGAQVPKDATHIHYGDGSTETELTLDPGAYELTLQFANGAHESYGPKMAATIKVTVE